MLQTLTGLGELRTMASTRHSVLWSLTRTAKASSQAADTIGAVFDPMSAGTCPPSPERVVRDSGAALISFTCVTSGTASVAGLAAARRRDRPLRRPWASPRLREG